MNFRVFLKPDWRKIVIFLVLLLFLFYFELNRPIVKCIGGDICKKYCLLGIPEPLPPVTKTYVKDTSACCCYFKFDNLEFYNISPLLYWIIYTIFLYLLSCLIVWIYDKFKKRK